MTETATNPDGATSVETPLPAWKRRVFVAATMGVPVALVLVLELVLRLFG